MLPGAGSSLSRVTPGELADHPKGRPPKGNGKIRRFDCYPEGTIVLTQLGVLGNLSAALEH